MNKGQKGTGSIWLKGGENPWHQHVLARTLSGSYIQIPKLGVSEAIISAFLEDFQKLF